MREVLLYMVNEAAGDRSRRPWEIKRRRQGTAEPCCWCDAVVSDKKPHQTLRFRGETRHFCSEDCYGKYLEKHGGSVPRNA